MSSSSRSGSPCAFSISPSVTAHFSARCARSLSYALSACSLIWYMPQTHTRTHTHTHTHIHNRPPSPVHHPASCAARLHAAPLRPLDPRRHRAVQRALLRRGVGADEEERTALRGRLQGLDLLRPLCALRVSVCCVCCVSVSLCVSVFVSVCVLYCIVFSVLNSESMRHGSPCRNLRGAPLTPRR